MKNKSLRYIKNKINGNCLEAVIKNGFNLQYIEEQNENIKSQIAFDTTLTKGKVLIHLSCESDSINRYSLYLPRKYSIKKISLVI